MSGRIIVQQENISRAERSLTNPLNGLQEAIHYSFITFCICCFSHLYEFFVHYALRVEKNYQRGFDVGPFELQLLRLRGCLTYPFRIMSLRFGVIGKTPGLISRNNFVKIFCLHRPSRYCLGKMWVDLPFYFICVELFTTRASPIGTPRDIYRGWAQIKNQCTVLPLLRCQGVCNKTCTQLSLPQILFQNPKNYNFEDVQRFCYHSWCDSTVILNKSATAAMFTSFRVDFGRPPLSSSSTSSLPSWNREYHLKWFDRLSLLPISLLHQY